MPKLFDRVKVNIATTGTGTVTFGSASSNAFLTPTEAGCADADTVRYVIVDGTDFEEGIGTIASSVATMERTTVTKSKIGGTAGTSKINLSGSAVLALTASAADIVNAADITATGEALLTAANAGAALDNLGGTTVGKALLTAADEAAALAALPSTYHKANILGTVSQSGGVPTGAIIEQGSNANGSYVRYADGTQICWKNITFGSFDIVNAFFGGFRSTSIVWTLPASFSSTPTTSASGSGLESFGVCVASATTSTVTVIFNAVSSQGSASRSAQIVAIGRWF